MRGQVLRLLETLYDGYSLPPFDVTSNLPLCSGLCGELLVAIVSNNYNRNAMNPLKVVSVPAMVEAG